MRPSSQEHNKVWWVASTVLFERLERLVAYHALSSVQKALTCGMLKGNAILIISDRGGL